MPLTIRNLDAPGTAVQLTPITQADAQRSGCCGGNAPAGADACCALDADVKSAGGSGCGCGTTTEQIHVTGTPSATVAPATAPAAKGCC